LLSEKLARLLDAKVGQRLTVEVQEGRREVLDVNMAGTIAEYSGMNAYMHMDALRKLMKEGDRSSGAYLQIDRSHELELYASLKETPQVAFTSIKSAMIQNFEDSVAENLLLMRLFNIGFATVIAFGVVYNSARISLAERSRELSTLRVIGFSRGEISGILLGELAALTAVAIPLGMFLGYLYAGILTLSLDTRIYRIPLVVENRTFAAAGLTVMIAAVISGLIVRRRIDVLDLVAVLKSRE